MKRVLFSISLLLLILPVQVEGQSLVNKSEFSGQDEISVEETGNYNILTPVLQRDMFHSYEQANEESPGSGLSPFRSLMSSLILPGSSQARQGKWWKAGLFMAVEAASIYMIIDLRNRARNGEAQYEQFADQNWSVVQYSQWLVEYHDYHQIDNPFIEELREMVSGVHPAFNNRKDWNTVNIDLLRLVEQNTPYFTPDGLSSGFFSHVLPSYGSQQYYELIAKYYQFQAGWKDYDAFHNSLGHTGGLFGQRFFIDRNGQLASPFFFRAASIAEEFNTDFRRSGHFLSLLIANHVFSGFDAYFTVKLKQNRLKATSNVLTGELIRLTYQF